MFEKVLPKNTHAILAKIGGSKVLPSQTYLAGGTACALQIGHRVSYDLDFFTPDDFEIEMILAALRGLNCDFTLARRAEHTILGSFPAIKFSLFRYPYKLLDKLKNYNGIELASLQDIVAMKINAIADRGAKRDFVDLYFMMEKLKMSLGDILGLYDKKYGKLADNRLHILKSLIYFDQADGDADPEMLIDWDFSKIKEFFIGAVKELS